MKNLSGSVWDILLRQGIVQGEAPVATGKYTPWYVKALLGFSGWLAASFLLGFIGIGFEVIIRSELASLLIGILMISGALAILRLPRNEFAEHLALAVSLAGQALAVYAIFEFVGDKDEVAWIIVALMQAVLACIMPNFLHRVFSSSFASISFFMALFSLRWPYIFNGIIMLLSAWLWLNEFTYPGHVQKFRATGYGLVLSLVSINGWVMSEVGLHRWGTLHYKAGILGNPWVGEVLAGVVMLYVIYSLLQQNGQKITGKFSILLLLGTLALTALSLEARGITAGVMIILLGFQGSNRVLTGLGIATLLSYISFYYYQLDLTLLAKSKSLFILGLALLTGRWVILRILPVPEEAEHVS